MRVGGRWRRLFVRLRVGGKAEGGTWGGDAGRWRSRVDGRDEVQNEGTRDGMVTATSDACGRCWLRWMGQMAAMGQCRKVACTLMKFHRGERSSLACVLGIFGFGLKLGKYEKWRGSFTQLPNFFVRRPFILMLLS